MFFLFWLHWNSLSKVRQSVSIIYLYLYLYKHCRLNFHHQKYSVNYKIINLCMNVVFWYNSHYNWHFWKASLKSYIWTLLLNKPSKRAYIFRTNPACGIDVGCDLWPDLLNLHFRKDHIWTLHVVMAAKTSVDLIMVNGLETDRFLNYISQIPRKLGGKLHLESTVKFAMGDISMPYPLGLWWGGWCTWWWHSWEEKDKSQQVQSLY